MSNQPCHEADLTFDLTFDVNGLVPSVEGQVIQVGIYTSNIDLVTNYHSQQDFDK